MSKVQAIYAALETQRLKDAQRLAERLLSKSNKLDPLVQYVQAKNLIIVYRRVFPLLPT